MKPFFLAVTLIAVLITSAIAQNPEPSPALFQNVEGNWRWEDDPVAACQFRPQVLTFSGDRTKLIARESGQETTYNVLYAEKNQLTLLVDGETRRTDFGDRVIWVLISTGRDRYYWRRMDWKPKQWTGAHIRCP